MINKNAFHQRQRQKELAEWKENLISSFKIKASKANTDVQLGVNKYINALDSKIREKKELLAKRARAGDGSWESIKDDLKSAWEFMKSAANNASAIFKY